MDMWSFIIVFGCVLIFGGGLFFFLWFKTRRKKLTWNAEVWVLSDGIRQPIKDRNGNIISDLKLQDLRFFEHDIIEKVESKEAGDYYRLQRIDMPVEAVTNDYVDIIPILGKKNKYMKRVWVLLHDNSATLLKKGYDKQANAVFQPMTYDRMNMCVTNVAIRKERLNQNKSLLEKILPWIVTGLLILGMVGITYLNGQAQYDIAKENGKAMGAMAASTKYAIDKAYNMTRTNEELKQIDKGKEKPLGLQ